VKTFAIKIANFTKNRETIDFPAPFGCVIKSKQEKFAILIAKSTYFTLRIPLRKLQTLPSF